MEAVTVAELPSLKYNELRALCSSHGLPAKGKKNELVEALTAHLAQKAPDNDTSVQPTNEQPSVQPPQGLPEPGSVEQAAQATDQGVQDPQNGADAGEDAEPQDVFDLTSVQGSASQEVAQQDDAAPEDAPAAAQAEAPAPADDDFAEVAPAAQVPDAETLPEAQATELPKSPQVQANAQVQADGANAAAPAATTSVDEWETTEVPLEWMPVPLVKVLMPQATTTEQLTDAIQERLASKGFVIKSVLLSGSSEGGKSVALVRLQPPPVPWKAQVSDDASGAAAPLVNVFSIASEASKAVHGTELSGGKLVASADYQRVVLAIGNLPETWQSRDALNDAMLHFGGVERVCMITNAAGLPKGYAVVEFSLPSAAQAAYDAMKKATAAANDRKAEQSKQAAASAEPSAAAGSPVTGRDSAPAATQVEGAPEPTSTAHADEAAPAADAAPAESGKADTVTADTVTAEDTVTATPAAAAVASTSKQVGKEVEIAAPLRAVYSVSKAHIPRCEYAKIGTVMQNWSKTLHVAQLPADLTTNNDIRTRFASLAGCEEAHVTANVVMRKSPPKPRPDGTCTPIGYAFVTFVRADLADTAYRAAAASDPLLCAVFVTPGKDVNTKQRAAKNTPNAGNQARTGQIARGQGRMGDRGGRMGRGGRGPALGAPRRMGSQGRGQGAAPLRGPGFAAVPSNAVQGATGRGGPQPGRRVMGSGRGAGAAGRMGGRGRGVMGGRSGRGDRGAYGGPDGASGRGVHGGGGGQGAPRRMGARASAGAASPGEGAFGPEMQHGGGMRPQAAPGPIYGHVQPHYVMAPGGIVGDPSQYQIVYQQPSQQPFQVQPQFAAQPQFAMASPGQQQGMAVAYVQQAPQMQVQQHHAPQAFVNPADYQAASYQSGYEQGFAGAGQKRGASYHSTYPGGGFEGNKRARF